MYELMSIISRLLCGSKRTLLFDFLAAIHPSPSHFHVRLHSVNQTALAAFAVRRLTC